MDFTAVKFETAGVDTASACAVGIVVVEKGFIVERLFRFIRPKELNFDPLQVKLHGISEDLVIDEPEFDVIWPEISGYFDGRTVVAHFASYDYSVLNNVLEQYNLKQPSFSLYCTYSIAKKCWPGLASYTLDSLSFHLGFKFKDHDPLQDALTSSEIAVRACVENGAGDLSQLAAKIEFRHTPLMSGAEFELFKHLTNKKNLSVLQNDSKHPFLKRRVEIADNIEPLSRQEALRHAVNCGRMYVEKLSEHT